MPTSKLYINVLEGGAERGQVPIRVKFEFELTGGAFVLDTLSVDIPFWGGIVQASASRDSS